MSDGLFEQTKVVPARLSFLAIYNPSLGTTDETFRDQVVFYYSRAAKERRKLRLDDGDLDKRNQEEENEKLRQVGLAQGMVDFAKSFSNGQSVDSVETEKSRIVIHELESGWWILASIDLTRLPTSSSSVTKTTGGESSEAKPSIEYSAREVSSSALLVKQLERAYSIFLLHHASSLSDLWARLSRSKFCGTLERFWNRFAQSWDVLLHGNPAADLYGGIKLAAGGELGMGVGEEEWGSGEREVLEDYVRRTDGLVDLIVSRYGNPPNGDSASLSGPSKPKSEVGSEEKDPWLGKGRYPEPSDGVIFSGIGAISRKSTQHISRWMETIYAYGEDAYGVGECPTSSRRKRAGRTASKKGGGGGVDTYASKDGNRRAQRKAKNGSSPVGMNGNSDIQKNGPGIPPPIVSAAEQSLKPATSVAIRERKSEGNESQQETSAFGDPETWMKYLTLGYGSSWGGSVKRPSTEKQLSPTSPARRPSHTSQVKGRSRSSKRGEAKPDKNASDEAPSNLKADQYTGQFLIGLQGDLDNEDTEDAEAETETNDEASSGWNSRIILRTLHVELLTSAEEDESRNEGGSNGPMFTNPETAEMRADPFKTDQILRMLVYIRQPFMFTFLFWPQTMALTIPSFYRTIHHHLGPLQKPLLSSTSPSQVAARLANYSHSLSTIPNPSASPGGTNPIFDLVYDPSNLTVHTSIPNIPLPATLAAEGLGNPWTRLEALNVHTQIINAYASTRRSRRDLERTAKTSRGWWVVWMRLPNSGSEAPDTREVSGDEDYKEAVLIRRASDYVGSTGRNSSLRVPSSSNATATSWAPGKLAEGIGVDARKYIESLLSLNR